MAFRRGEEAQAKAGVEHAVAYTCPKAVVLDGVHLVRDAPLADALLRKGEGGVRRAWAEILVPEDVVHVGVEVAAYVNHHRLAPYA